MTKYNEQPAGLRIPSVGDPDLEQELRDRCWTSIVLGRPYADIWNDLSADLDLVPAQRPSAERAFRSFVCAELDSPSRRGRALGPKGSDSSAEWDGYAFYHSQDAERLVETGSTYVAFGVFLRRYLPIDEIKAMSPAERDAFADEKAEALARSVIVPTFEMYGIDVEWDGSAGSRMALHDVDYYVPLNEGGLKDERAVGG